MGVRRTRSRRAAAVVIGTLVLGAAAPLVGARVAAVRAAPTCPWMDASKPVETRAHELLAAMTIDDKITMVHQSQFLYFGTAGYIPANPNLCIPELLLNDAGAGVGDGQPSTTAFPAPIAQSASWDPSLQRQFGQALGSEAWHKGINVQLAPGINIARVPMNGRNFEYMGEDPYLSGQGAVAEITGIQQNPVIATVKHYAANNQETNRMSISSDIDERTLHEIYLPAFEAAVTQGHPGSVMCSYNKVDNIFACEQPMLLNSVLKQQFGFDGFVMSDWGGQHSTVPSALAGLDMEMNVTSTYYGTPLKAAVQAGQVPAARFDDMILRILRSMFRIGLFDHPAPAEPAAYTAVASTPTDVTLARTISEQGSVLLKNQGAVLPITGTQRRIALIGPAAGPVGVQLAYGGQGSSHVPEVGGKPDVVSPLAGITQRALADTDAVVYADGTATADAVAAASAADVAVVFANDSESEGVDRSNLSLNSGACALVGCVPLPSSQDALIAAVAQANPNTIVVLNTGGPVLMPWLSSVKGLIEAWYPGQEDGNAIAALLFGDVNPSGKLPQTFPRSAADLPTQTAQQYPGVNGHAVYSEGLQVGYRWYEARGITPLFPFGFGLSYTTFAYHNLTVAPAPSPAGVATVGFDVTNTGTRPGAEIAQLYVGAPPDNSVHEPLKQLRGYGKVSLQPGQTAHLTLPVDARAVSYWNTTTHGWARQAGCHPVLVGASSADIRLSGPALDASLTTCGAGVAPAHQPAVASTSTLTGLANTGTGTTATGAAVAAVATVIALLPLARRRRRATQARGRRVIG